MNRRAGLAAGALALGVVALGCDSGMGSAGMCQDTCRHARDGECDDGRAGSVTSLCALGTDCADCGPVPGGGSRDSGGGNLDPSECLALLTVRPGPGFDGRCAYNDSCANMTSQAAGDFTVLECDWNYTGANFPRNYCACFQFDFARGELIQTPIIIDFGDDDPCTRPLSEIIEIAQSRCGWVAGPDRHAARLGAMDSGMVSGDRDAGPTGRTDAGPQGGSDAGVSGGECTFPSDCEDLVDVSGCSACVCDAGDNPRPTGDLVIRRGLCDEGRCALYDPQRHGCEMTEEYYARIGAGSYDGARANCASCGQCVCP